MEESDDVEALRAEMDALNVALVGLLCRRGALARRIQQAKQKVGRAAIDPAREEAQLAALLAENQGPYPDALIAEIFRRLFAASLLG